MKLSVSVSLDQYTNMGTVVLDELVET